MRSSAQRIQFPKLRSIDSLLPASKHYLDGLSRAFTAVHHLDEARCLIGEICIGSQGVTIHLLRAPAPGFVGGHNELVVPEGDRKVRVIRATYMGVTLEWRAPEYHADPSSDLDARGAAGRI